MLCVLGSIHVDKWSYMHRPRGGDVDPRHSIRTTTGADASSSAIAMIVTEIEAAKLFCPHRQSPRFESEATCLGSACSQWRWEGPIMVGTEPVPRHTVPMFRLMPA